MTTQQTFLGTQNRGKKIKKKETDTLKLEGMRKLQQHNQAMPINVLFP